MSAQMLDSRLPWVVEVVHRVQESPTIFSLALRFTDGAAQAAYGFDPGQFNMLALPGIGEVPISIVSDPAHEGEIHHAIRAVGRVTHALAALRPGDRLGLRGPYGRGWPLAEAEGRDLVIVTGGLGCAPVVAVIHYVMRRRDRFGRLSLVQGVKHADDLIWRAQYEAWMKMPDVEVQIAADAAGPDWPWHVGRVTELIDRLNFCQRHSLAMMCGPEPMMLAAADSLRERGIEESAIWLSMERNMQCGVGLCGHCQIGPHFVCRDGPVFRLDELAGLIGVRGL
ncbi:FAD/NAD(P)-binding protein [Thiohalobacter sp.]|uniref:FAD/NAD(P)-binding protein n=1 Tax=Thiohalobacter sp. TaxID=2025948 RepID=UPI00263516A2|nr:FAD/NAD(P)-binding protein [Thiohalobacter sp.]